MTAAEIVAELEPLGGESYRKVLRNHGIADPMFGVKIEELKKFQKRIKKDYRLALDLYDTGIYDAMYLAGLIADDARMTRDDLQQWVETATCSSVREWTVAWVAAESSHGWELGLQWIDSEYETIAAAGWSTLGSLVSIKADCDLDSDELRRLLDRVRRTIHDQPNRVRYTMNSFVIGVGCYVRDLTDFAVQIATEIGKVSVNMGATACKVPSATEYIEKVRARGTIGKKRATAKC